MTITELPAAPSRSDAPADFITKADAFLAALATFRTEANALAVAMNLNSTTDASASSVAIGTGAKTFAVTAGKSFQPGMALVIADTAAPSTNWMYGLVTSYAGTSLVMSILATLGSGTKTAWTISQSSAGLAANGDVAATSLNGGQFGGLRNKVINGAMSIWQRGTSFAAPTNLAYLADRWFNIWGAAGRTYSRQSGFSGAQYCLRAQRDSGNAVTTAFGIAQILESTQLYALQGKTVALSFDVRAGANFSPGSGNISISVTSGTTSDQGASSYWSGAWTGVTSVLSAASAISASASRFISTPFTIPAGCLELAIVIQATPTGTAGAADYFEVTNIQLEVGSVPTTFESLSQALELELCQRYFEKSFPLGTTPAQNAGAGTGEFNFMAGKAGALAEFGYIPYKTRKRGTPATITTYNPAAANAQVRDITAAADCSAVATANSTDTGFRIGATGNASTAVGNILGAHWTAEAEL